MVRMEIWGGGDEKEAGGSRMLLIQVYGHRTVSWSAPRIILFSSHNQLSFLGPPSSYRVCLIIRGLDRIAGLGRSMSISRPPS